MAIDSSATITKQVSFKRCRYGAYACADCAGDWGAADAAGGFAGAVCPDAMQTEETIAGGQSKTETTSGKDEARGKVVPRLGTVPATCLPSPASRGDARAWTMKGSGMPRRNGVTRIAHTRAVLDTGDSRKLHAATVCSRNLQMRLAASGSLP